MLTLRGHTVPVRALAYSPEGVLASGDDDGTVVFWNVSTGAPRLTRSIHKDRVQAVAFSPDGHHFASVGWDDSLRVHSGHRWGKLLWREDRLVGGGWCVAFAPDSWSVAVGCGDGTGLLCHLRRDEPAIRRELVGHVWPLCALAFSPNGRRLATAGHDHMIRLWDAHWGVPSAFVSCLHDNWVRTLAFSSDGRLLASGSDDRLIKLWDVQEEQFYATFAGHDSYVLRIGFTPDGRTLLSAGADGTVRAWDVGSGRMVSAFDWGLGSVLALAIAPDGLTAAAAGASGEIIVWDLDQF